MYLADMDELPEVWLVYLSYDIFGTLSVVVLVVVYNVVIFKP